MTEQLEWLRYGALGFSGLALVTAASLLTVSRLKEQGIKHGKLILAFMVFAALLAIVAAGKEIFERTFPDPASKQRLAELQAQIDTKLKENAVLQQRAEYAEAKLNAANNGAHWYSMNERSNWSGLDIASTEGTIPKDSVGETKLCDIEHIDFVAICYDGRGGGYPPHVPTDITDTPANWCTYRSSMNSRSDGGSAAGRIYMCKLSTPSPSRN